MAAIKLERPIQLQKGVAFHFLEIFQTPSLDDKSHWIQIKTFIIALKPFADFIYFLSYLVTLEFLKKNCIFIKRDLFFFAFRPILNFFLPSALFSSDMSLWNRQTTKIIDTYMQTYSTFPSYLHKQLQIRNTCSISILYCAMREIQTQQVQVQILNFGMLEKN